ncbi:MAG: thiamine phosphate synthase [Planctomycetes bacterium]|nr:thiamine phosphate synthase [Planctomycetota bacterium]
MDDRERSSTLRILDANLNRAVEALRVAEEVCRLHWSSEGLAADLKALRHEVFAILSAGGIDRPSLLARRDIEGDVGRETASPGSGRDPADMAFRNLGRAKEALRVLEEACRLLAPDAAPKLLEARYRLYAIERGVGSLGPRSRPLERLLEAKVYLLATAGLARLPLEDAVRAALEAGVRAVQLREKGLSDRDLLRDARALREATARSGALFLVNDRVDIAILCHADGVHLGQEDLPVAEARKLAGREILVGVSTHSPEQALEAQRLGADYIGAGPIFPTSTKDAGPLLGPAGLRRVLGEVSIPTFAIGGVSSSNVRLVASAGGTRVAVSSSVLGSQDPAGEVRALLQGLEESPPPAPGPPVQGAGPR